MGELTEINAIPKTGDEVLTDNNISTKYNLMDFWRWSVSDLLSNATRGRFAEFIVGTAIDLDPRKVRDEWGAYDLESEDGMKIEVKSASYVQSWYQKDFSSISFSIKPAIYWDSATNLQHGEPKRHADLYVFCHLKHKDQDTIDPLRMEQWDFYVLPTYRLDNYERSQSSITLTSLKKMADPKAYNELRNEIKKAYEDQMSNVRS